jgi:hypothetical protein
LGQAFGASGASGFANKTASKTDADSYTVSIHVSAVECGNDRQTIVPYGDEILTVTIAGKHFRLEGPTSSARAYSHGNGLLNLGDYPAKLTSDVHKTSYESAQIYELLLPDNSTRKFSVIGQWE